MRSDGKSFWDSISLPSYNVLFAEWDAKSSWDDAECLAGKFYLIFFLEFFYVSHIVPLLYLPFPVCLLSSLCPYIIVLELPQLFAEGLYYWKFFLAVILHVSVRSVKGSIVISLYLGFPLYTLYISPWASIQDILPLCIEERREWTISILRKRPFGLYIVQGRPQTLD